MLFPAPAVKNQETSHLFLNSEDEQPESRVVIEKGVMWEYSNTAEKESIQTTGPLKYGVLLMVSPSPSSQSDTWTVGFSLNLLLLPIRSIPGATPRSRCPINISSKTAFDLHWSLTY